jgi:putative flippase GtrA
MATLVRNFMRFAAVGVLATATHTLVFALAIEWLSIEPVTATAIAFTAALLVGYTLNRRWTFAAHAEHGRLWRYAVAALVGLAGNTLIMAIVVHGAKWSPYVGLALSVILMPPLSFALNQLWVFRSRT